MTTDTAVRVTRMVVLDQLALDAIPYVDFPELKIDEHETTEMPFRYVIDQAGKPIMPEVVFLHLVHTVLLTYKQGMIDLIKADADKAFDDVDFIDEVEAMDNLKVGKP
jgi:hypothetical protein